jgi:nitrate reductase gamma subunit
MEGLLEFAKGPLFRITFALMILGLLRILILDIWGMIEATRRAGDKNIPWGQAFGKMVAWLFPVKRVAAKRPVYSIISVIFHIGMLSVPIFLFAHIELWKGALGFGWISLNKGWADVLTIITIVAGVALFVGRVAFIESRQLSRKQDYFWPLLILIPFVTGYICANMAVSPEGYRFFMLVHVLAAELIFVLLPFTKIAHCVLMPLSQFIITVAWRFPANTDDAVCTTLNKKGAPV